MIIQTIPETGRYRHRTAGKSVQPILARKQRPNQGPQRQQWPRQIKSGIGPLAQGAVDLISGGKAQQGVQAKNSPRQNGLETGSNTFGPGRWPYRLDLQQCQTFSPPSKQACAHSGPWHWKIFVCRYSRAVGRVGGPDRPIILQSTPPPARRLLPQTCQCQRPGQGTKRRLVNISHETYLTGMGQKGKGINQKQEKSNPRLRHDRYLK